MPQVPQGAVGTMEHSDGTRHYVDAKGTDLGSVSSPPPSQSNDLVSNALKFGKGFGGTVASAAVASPLGQGGLGQPMSDEQLNQPFSLKDAIKNRLSASQMLDKLINDLQSINPLKPSLDNPHDPEALGQTSANVAMLARGLGQAGAPSDMTNAANGLVRGTAKATNAVLEKAPGTLGAGVGAAIGREFGAPGMGAAAGYALGKEVLPRLRVPGEQFGLEEAKFNAPAKTNPTFEQADPKPRPPTQPPSPQEMSDYYRSRMTDIQAEIRDAARAGDSVRAKAAQNQLDQLMQISGQKPITADQVQIPKRTQGGNPQRSNVTANQRQLSSPTGSSAPTPQSADFPSQGIEQPPEITPQTATADNLHDLLQKSLKVQQLLKERGLRIDPTTQRIVSAR